MSRTTVLFPLFPLLMKHFEHFLATPGKGVYIFQYSYCRLYLDTYLLRYLDGLSSRVVQATAFHPFVSLSRQRHPGCWNASCLKPSTSIHSISINRSQLISQLVHLFHEHVRPSLWRSSSRTFHVSWNPLQGPLRPSVVSPSYDMTGPSIFRLQRVFRWVSKTGHPPEIGTAKSGLMLSSPVVLQKTPFKRPVGGP